MSCEKESDKTECKKNVNSLYIDIRIINLFGRSNLVIKYSAKNWAASCGLAAVLIATSASMPAIGAEQTVDECSRELLLTYFPEPFVKETLKTYNVPEDKWDAIQKSLANKDKDVIQIVEKKAAEMDPNPLKDPQARLAAVKLFRSTLLQLFSEVMQANGITDEKQIQAMLDGIQLQKAQRFAKCMQKTDKPE